MRFYINVVRTTQTTCKCGYTTPWTRWEWLDRARSLWHTWRQHREAWKFLPSPLKYALVYVLTGKVWFERSKK